MKPSLIAFIFFAFCSLVLKSQMNWQSTQGPEGGTLSSFNFNDSFAFFTDRYNLYRTSDGVNWEQLPFGNLWPIAVTNSKIAALKGKGYGYDRSKELKFLVSYDNGLNWKEGNLPPPKISTGFTNLAVCSHGIYIPDGVQNLIYKTTNDGINWESIDPPGLYCYDLYSFEDRLYALWDSKFWRLNLNGVDWELVSPDFGKGNYPNAMYISGDIRMFATSSVIVSSSDNGKNWINKSINYNNKDDLFVPIGNKIFKLGGTSQVYYTSDSGRNWNAIPIKSSHSIYHIAKAGQKLLGSAIDKGIFRLDESTNKFIPSNEGLFSASVYDMDTNDDYLWAACGNGVFAYNLKSNKWLDISKLPLPNYYYTQVSVNNSGYVACFESYSYNLYVSTNFGASWDTISPFKPFNFGYIENITWLDDVLIIKDERSNSYKTVDFGKTWANIICPDEIVKFKGAYFGIQKSEKKLTKSIDLGLSWQSLNNPGQSLYKIFSTENMLFIFTYNSERQTALYSSDDGVNWKYSNDGLPDIGIEFFYPYQIYPKAWFISGTYLLYEPTIGFYISKDSLKTWLPIEKGMYSKLEIRDSICYAGGNGGGVIKSSMPANYGSVSTGVVFKDDNNNGSKELNEIVIPRVIVSMSEPDAWFPYWFTSTNNEGRYFLGNSIGSCDTVKVRLPSQYPFSSNPTHHITKGNSSGLDFGIHFENEIVDAAISGAFAGHPRPGFELNTIINYQNLGTTVENGKISLKLDPSYRFVSSEPAPDLIFRNDSLVWNFNQLSLFENRYIRVLGKIDQSSDLGSKVHMRGHIQTKFADDNSKNDHFEFSDTVVGSFDPNEKLVEPELGLTYEEILQGKELIYTIHFQNTGNFQADKVRITDHLDTAFNLKSLRYISSSHPVTEFQLLPGRLLEIIFDNINLADIHSNEPASHGFVKFAIQWNKSFSTSYKIKNRANIYFDFNDPIITNVTQSKVLVSANDVVKDFKDSSNKILIVPNPANKNVHLYLKKNPNGPLEINLLDLNGKIVLTEYVENFQNGHSLQLAELNKGLYLLSVKSNEIYFSKLVVGN